jgi:DNA-binding transcriptional LysR family regulator
MAHPLRVRINDLSFFTVFADCLNFSEAARQLHISQPALHVKIRKLSEQMDAVLYRRFGRQLRLTPQGELVARFGREMQAGAQALAQRLHHGAGSEPVVLAAGTGAYMYLLGVAVQRYLRGQRAPLRLLTLDRDQSIQALLSGKAQLAVAPADTLPAEITAQHIATVGQSLVLPRNHPLTRKREIRLHDLEGCRLVVPPAGQPHRAMLARLLQAAGVNWEVAVETSGWELIMRFVQMDAGLAVVNACCIPPKGLVSIPVPELPVLKFQLLRLRGGALGEDAKTLQDLLLAETAGWRNA